jgi:hypothetical protein
LGRSVQLRVGEHELRDAIPISDGAQRLEVHADIEMTADRDDRAGIRVRRVEAHVFRVSVNRGFPERPY